MVRHYLDHASTSPPRPEVVSAIEAWFHSPAADPGRVHEEGRFVREAIEIAREDVATLLGVRPRQVVFTASGTEAANTAVWSATRAQADSIILCSGVEHSAVRDSSTRFAQVRELGVDADAVISLDELKNGLHQAEAPALVHWQWANHEVGTLQPVHEAVALCHEAGVPIHVDAAAACGHVPLDLGALNADLVSISGHKFGAGPGIGVLVVRRGARIEPLLVGGQQERARRAGMENVPGILGLGAAARALTSDESAIEGAASMARHQIAGLEAAALAVEGVSVVGPDDPVRRLPHLVCLCIDGVEAEPVLLGLDRGGIAAHSGSACSSEGLEPSPVLAAMGADPNCSLRLSVGWSTTDDDVGAFAEAFPRVVAGLRALR